MPDFSYESEAIKSGKASVCGVDEAGRGPLAGPVVAAAVIMNPGTLSDPAWARLNDSKKMAANARDDLFDHINAHAKVGVGIIDIDQIDILNILGATMKAMADAVRDLPTTELAWLSSAIAAMPALTAASLAGKSQKRSSRLHASCWSETSCA